jgi:hypothetical protein
VTTTDQYGHWTVDHVGDFNPEDWVGFIYEIEHLPTGRLYIGRKLFKAKRKKTKSNPSRTKSSDWQTYTSSSETVNSLIKDEGKDQFAFRIILLCIGKCMLNYEEESIQRERDVLRARLPDGTRKYFNNTIGYKNFGGLDKQTEQAKEKIRQSKLGKPAPWVAERNRLPVSDTTRENMRQSALGRTASDETRRKQSQAHLGKTQSADWVAKRIVASSATRKGMLWWTDGTQSQFAKESPGVEWRRGRQYRRKTNGEQQP